MTFNVGVKAAVWDNVSETWGTAKKFIAGARIDQWYGNSIDIIFITDNLEIEKPYFWQIENGYIELSADL